MKLKYAIALSGGIASGKSTAASLLRLYGYCVICADGIAHKVLEENKDEIVNVFGREILDSDSKINRKKLGKIVFEDSKKRIILEEILHPKIREEILKQAQTQESKKIPYFVDIPLFFETNAYPITHSLLIGTTEELQLKRLKERNNLTEIEAMQRIKAQMPLSQKCALASFVIENNTTLEDLQKKLEDYLAKHLPKI